MSRADLADNTCSVARTIEILGDVWTLMILREAFLGNRRFDDLKRQTGASPHALSQRLKRLERIGVLRLESYSEHPPRHEYRLTTKGRDLWPVIVTMKAWGDKWLGEGSPSIEIRHKGCGLVVIPEMTCSACHAPMNAHDAKAIISPELKREREAVRRQA